MFADGLFDLFCWIVTLIALAMLYREARRGALPRGKTYIGWMLIGGGAFNFIEGLVDHELLGIHHVHPGPNWLAWDIGFLVIGGMLLVAIGWVLKQEQERSPAQKLRAA